MASLPSFINPIWERDVDGTSFYDITSFDEWSSSTSNNVISQNHPILTPAILFVAKLFSQANFRLENKRTKKVVDKHWILDVLHRPNSYQTSLDFLETLLFSMIANGMAVVLKKRVIGFDKFDSLYVLNPEHIEWPANFSKKYITSTNPEDTFKNEVIKYTEDGKDKEFYIKDLMFFYDLPNFLNKNPLKVKSRLDGLKQTLINTQDSLIAKNIILKSNGKELLSLKKDSIGLSAEEKKEAESLLNLNYGLSRTRKRGLITRADLDWKSLHIALRDLGLDESIKVDGNLIFSALHIPKDILSLEAKKTTYNNFKESMTSYIQNELQSTLNAILATFQLEIKETNIVLKGDYDHLPVMQYAMKEKFDVIQKQATALNYLLKTGVPKEIALEMCDMPTDIELGELFEITQNEQRQQTEESNEGRERDDE
jgi:HK97 family phage portal protein